MDDMKDLSKLRHSAAHLAAHAVLELFPDTLLTIGPATPEGFFYDFLPIQNFKEEDLSIIERKMQELAEKDLVLSHREIPKAEARILFANNRFKLQLIDEIPGETVGLSQQGDFYDLCKGGHVCSTKELKHVKLLGLSGSYWKADRKGQPLQRITGTAFFTAQELEDFLKRKEDALAYDHRRIGKQLNLFSFHDEGVGFPFFHAKGKLIINLLINYLREIQEKNNYQEVSTPVLLNDALWKQSGHYAHYKDNMYFCHIDEQDYAIKPMNCPGAFLIYKERPHSYRELPLKLAEFGLVHRHELSGVLHGLMRVRAFTQDDAHIFCTAAQLSQEISSVITLTFSVLQKFSFNNVKVAISTKPKNAIGNDELLWRNATDALKESVEKEGIAYKIKEGEGAFYGPKIEFLIEDSMQREWQCGTIQIDFSLPENFDLHYINSQGMKDRPVVIHRAIYGSLERFFAILLEHYKGNLPFWLSPVQIKILTITDDQKEYAQNIKLLLEDKKYRVESDDSSDQIGAKIKAAQMEKIPVMIVIGKKEVSQNTVTLRYRNGKQILDKNYSEMFSLLEKIEREM